MSWMHAYIDECRRIRFDELRKQIVERSVGMREFIAAFPYPFIVGGEIFKGAFGGSDPDANPAHADASRGAAVGQTDTIKFRIELNPNTNTRRQRRCIPATMHGAPPEESVYALFMRPSAEYGDSLEATIGKAPGNDIIVMDQTVSRCHAKFVLHQGNYFIRDMNSTNGTKVSFRNIDSTQLVPLLPNMRISFGRVVFVFLPSNLFMGMMYYPE